MKIILKALFLSIAILSLASCAQTDPFTDTKIRAEKGYSVPQYELGLMYYNGNGVEKNDQLAVKWLKLAGEQGHSGAQYFLGSMYETGKGVSQNDQEAVQWYRLAADNGIISASIKVESTLRAISNRAQGRDCNSNADEIGRQLDQLSSAYDARLEDIRSRSLEAGLRGTAAYGLGGYSRGVAESGLDRARDQLELQKARDIADLRSRIIEVCDPVPAPRDNSTAIERSTNIATTLQELNELFESGALTEEEFQAGKRKALGLE